MTKRWKMAIIASLLLAGAAMAQPYGMGPGHGGYGPGPGYGMGPGFGGGYGMGPGRGEGYGPGYGMGPGMMDGYGPGWGMGPGMMGGYGGGPGRGPGAWGDRGLAQLDLSADQRQKIGEIEAEAVKAMWGLMGTMHEQRYRLGSAGPQDEEAARKAFDAMTETRKAMFELQLQARKRIDAVLTPEQRDQLRKGG